jgi:opacity protein-like surface antigen
MKRSVILLAIASMMSMSAFAGTGTGAVQVEVDQLSPKVGEKVNTVSVAPGMFVGSTYVDLKLAGVRTAQGSNTQLAEIRASQLFSLAPKLDAFVRGGFGTILQTDKNTTFYEGEVGIKYAVVDTVSLNTSYKFTNATQKNQGIKANTVYVGADYIVTASDTVGAKLYKAYGDNKGSGFQVAYTKAF